MNKLVFFFVLIISVFHAHGQTLVRGNISDSASGKPVIATTIGFSDSTMKFGDYTDENGDYQVQLSPGTYNVEVQAMGFQLFIDTIQIHSAKERVYNLRLIAVDIALDEVGVKAKIPPVQMKGDTAEFNAQGYKTTENANAKDLLGKMPGMQTDGDVKAGGEKVQQVLVDGKPFFGQDANTALSTLPAEVVDKIQVFDDQSDQAKQSGVDDGDRVKTINIVTKINMRNGEFGRAYAGAGSDSRYSAGANLNMFRGDQRVSFLGQINNINQQNFSTEDLLGVTGDNSDSRHGRYRRGFSVGSNASDFMVNPSNGITQTIAGGLNYQNTFTEKFEMSGSYFFNRANTFDRTLTFQNYYLNEAQGQQYNEQDTTESLNTNHRLSARLQYKVNDKVSFFMRPRISVQQNTGESIRYGVTSQENVTINTLNQMLTTELRAVSWSNDLMYRQSFDKKGRMFFVSLELGQGNTIGDKLLDASNAGTQSIEQFQQRAELDNQTLSYEIDVRYSEPLNDKGLGLDLSYELSNDISDYEKYTYDQLNSNRLLDSLSNSFNNDWLAHEYGIGVRKFEKGSGFIIRARYERANLINDQSFPSIYKTDKVFHSFVPFALYKKTFKDKSNVFVMYRTDTDAPGAEQLQNVLDNSNPLQLSIGNPDLNRQYEQMLRMRYQRNNVEKSRVFYFALNGRWSNSYLGRTTFTAQSDTVYNGVELESGNQLRSYANLKGYSQYDGFITYGFPVNLLKSNLNINVSGQYSKIPSLINDVQTVTENQSYQLGLSLASNVSEKLDFTISSETSYNLAQNSGSRGLNSSYYVQNSKMKLDWISKYGITVRSSLNHQVFYGLNSVLNNQVLLWNAGIGKQLFAKKQAEIQLTVFDILGQNNNISQDFYDSYYQEQNTLVIQRYIMLNFIYNFRVFRSEKEPQKKSDQ
ncbi:outer membrane beta-barrel protein [bacterium]|nr:outer membrane beta-barrel protein [bacterium]